MSGCSNGGSANASPLESVRLEREALNLISEPILIIGGLAATRGLLFANSAALALLKVPDVASTSLVSIWPHAADFALMSGEITAEFFDSFHAPVPVKLAVHRIDNNAAVVRVMVTQPQNDSARTFHAQRLETLGMLSGGIAHDFNNILAGILGHVTYLKTILPQSGSHIESIGAVEDGARKAAGMTQQILNFSRLESGQAPVAVDLGEVTLKTCGLVRRAVPADIKLEPELPDEPLAVLCVEGQLAQIIVNLVINARDAIALEGEEFAPRADPAKIVVGLSRVTERTELEQAFSGGDLSSIAYAKICVSDNGQGMSPEVLTKIFAPYFTTKKERGTGLGLATVATIVRRFGGAICVASELGKGTTVSVYFPEVALPVRGALSHEGVAARPTLARGTERVLIVDDEYPVRNVLAISLQHLGYEVVTAQSGAEALALYESAYLSEKTRFNLVMLDMLMPHMSGETLFFKLKDRDPSVRVLVMSGYTSAESINNILNNGGLDFLMKPFTIEELSRKVRECF